MTDKDKQDVQGLVPTIEEGFIMGRCLVTIKLPDARVIVHLLAERVRRVLLLEIGIEFFGRVRGYEGRDCIAS